MQKAVQQFMLGSVLKNEAQARETLAAVRSAGYDGIELCGFMLRPMGLLIRALTRAAGMPVGAGGRLDMDALVKESGLRVISLHEDLGTVERDAAAVVETAEKFGTDRVVITGMYRFDYGDEGAVRNLVKRLNQAGEALARQDVRLLYHNHNCELRKVNGRQCAYELLLEKTDENYVNFEFDSYWFTEGGADAKAWMNRLGSRMKLWHINDRGTRTTGPSITPILKSDSVELGTGNMDLEGMAKIAESCGVDAVVLESHRNWIDGSPVKSLELSAKWLNARF